MRAGKFLRASEISGEATEGRMIPCFGGGGLRGYVAMPSHAEGRILIGRQGALCGSVRRVRGPFYATEHAVVVTPRTGVDSRWAFHLLTRMDLHQYASKSAQPGLAVANIAQLEVPVPSYEEQQSIGSALDTFEAGLGNLSVNLSAETATRRKQYEYYRDKLLSFEEAA